MARIINKKDHLTVEHNKYKSKSAFCAFLSFVVIVVAVLIILFTDVSALWTIVGGVIAFIILQVIRTKSGNAAEIIMAGISGEKAASDIVKQLPDGYFGYTNLCVSFDGKSSEMDMVVVGKSGVFIIETKNHNGTIVGDYDAKQWRQNKVGRGGTLYFKDFYSPVKQVNTHVYRLANYLRQNGAYVHVDAIVYFSNEETELALTGDPKTTAVFSAKDNGAEALKSLILNANPAKRLTQADINKVCTILDR